MTTTTTVHAPGSTSPETVHLAELEAFLEEGSSGPSERRSPRPTPTGAWLTLAGFAAELGVSTNTAYKWSARGYPAFPHAAKLPNGAIRVARADFDAWMTERRQ